MDDPYDPRHDLPLEGEVDQEAATVSLERIDVALRFLLEITEEWKATPADDVSPHQRERLVKAMELLGQVRDLMVTDAEEG